MVSNELITGSVGILGGLLIARCYAAWKSSQTVSLHSASGAVSTENTPTGSASVDFNLWQQALQRRLQDRRSTHRVAVLSIEIDGLAVFLSLANRTAAQSVLRMIEETLLATLRQRDLVARVDDRRFVVLLGEGPSIEAQTAAERLRRAIAARHVVALGRYQAFTASVGLALAQPGEQTHDLLERAEAVQNIARAAGGDTVRVDNGAQVLSVDDALLASIAPPVIDVQAPPLPDMLGPQLAAIGVDSSTGLMDRRSFLDALREAVSECLPQQRPLSLLLLAIEDLQQLHREHGRLAGDALLRVITQMIRSTTRADFDQFGLCEHDTIGVVLIDADLPAALKGVERLRRGLVHCRLRNDGQDVSVQATIGVATLSAGGDALSLMQDAQRNLDSARHSPAPSDAPAAVSLTPAKAPL